MSLTQQQINQRMIELRNLRKLYKEQKIQNTKLHTENKALKARIKELEAKDKEKDQRITDLSLQMEELNRIVFGKGKKKDIDTDYVSSYTPIPRTKESYTRPIPNEEEITKQIHHSIHTCPDCSTVLTKKEEKIYYEEDILLPSKETPLKTITKYTIEKGYCTQCKRWKSTVPIPSTTVLLGKQIRIYICYLSILLRLSYEQIHTHLSLVHRMHISDGEIAKILTHEAKRLRPEYETLKERVRIQRGVHYDETPWYVQKKVQGNFAWTMTGTDTTDTVFHCGRSRGKGNAEDLKGNSTAIGISDDYGAYRTLFERHQLCFAHPYRKLRDLAQSSTLTEEVRTHCQQVYRDFGALYTKTQEVVDDPFSSTARIALYPTLIEKLINITQPHPQDPKKLINIKASLRKNKEKYFTCVLYEGIPLDNNKAERVLRHLVIKRKTSFGSKTQKGAEVTSVLLSVLLSLWWKRPEDYFGELLGLRGV